LSNPPPEDSKAAIFTSMAAHSGAAVPRQIPAAPRLLQAPAVEELLGTGRKRIISKKTLATSSANESQKFFPVSLRDSRTSEPQLKKTHGCGNKV
jgi:hypothetical protein